MIHGLDTKPATLADLERHIARVDGIIQRAEQHPRGTASMQVGVRRAQLRSLQKQAARLRERTNLKGEDV